MADDGPSACCAACYEEREEQQYGYDLCAVLPPSFAEHFVGALADVMRLVGCVAPAPRNRV